MQGERDSFGFNGDFGAPEKKNSIISNKENTKLCLSLHYNYENNYFLLTEKKSISLKQMKKLSALQLHFVQNAYLITLNLSSQQKYLYKEMFMILNNNYQIISLHSQWF